MGVALSTSHESTLHLQLHYREAAQYCDVLSEFVLEVVSSFDLLCVLQLLAFFYTN